MSELSALARLETALRAVRQDRVEDLARRITASLDAMRVTQGAVIALDDAIEAIQQIRSTIEEDDDGSAVES
jgi:hypothetical protein